MAFDGKGTLRGSSVILRPRWGDSSSAGWRSRTRVEDPLAVFHILPGAHPAETHTGDATTILGEDNLIGWQGHLEVFGLGVFERD